MNFKLLMALVFGLTTGLTYGKEPKNVTPSMLAIGKVDAATSHYKSVLTELADKETSAKIVRDKTERERLEGDVTKLRSEKESARKEVEDLAKAYNALLKKSRDSREDQKNPTSILIECEIAAENSHYKTVLTQIEDKKTAIALAKEGSDKQQAQSDLSILEDEKAETQKQIEALTKIYASLTKKQKVWILGT